MTLLTKFLVFGSLISLLLLTLISGYSYSQIRALSLPISQAFAIITLILPLATVLSTQTVYRLLRSSHASYSRPLICLAILAFQLIYETVVATLSLTYMVPNCRLEEQWARLYKNKDGNAIRRIQDRFNCCGFNTAVDRAWPFPHGRPEDGYGADQCKRMFGRVNSCLGSWRQEEQTAAGLFLMVAVVIFVLKSIVLVSQVSNNPLMDFFKTLITRDLDAHPNKRPGARLAINEGGPLAEEEQYRDEIDNSQDRAAIAEFASRNDSRPRVEPSRLVSNDGNALWGGET